MLQVGVREDDVPSVRFVRIVYETQRASARKDDTTHPKSSESGPSSDVQYRNVRGDLLSG